VFQRLPPRGRILDVGCSSSPLALQLACLGYQVTGVDVRGYPFTHPNLVFFQGDISRVTLEAASHDCAVLVGATEHVGYGHYGDGVGLPDREFLAAVAGAVKPGGTLLLTLPFGLSSRGLWYRVYDSVDLAALCEGYPVVTKRFARRLAPL